MGSWCSDAKVRYNIGQISFDTDKVFLNFKFKVQTLWIITKFSNM